MTNPLTIEFEELLRSLRSKASKILDAANSLEDELDQNGFEANDLQICLEGLEEATLDFRKAFEPEKWDLDIEQGCWFHQEWRREEEEEEE